MKKKLGLYIHIPFCLKKCYYCDFISFDQVNSSKQKDYIQALIEEIQEEGMHHTSYEVDTIFIGGGTPSILPISLMESLLDALFHSFAVDKNAEITLEANPKTLNSENLKFYQEVGINRLSMGLQTSQDALLKSLGRAHTYLDFLENYKLARNLGFSNINIDLMFGIPDQTIKELEETLHLVIPLAPDHISFYSLKVEENTPFGALHKKGHLNRPTDELDRTMYHQGIAYLKEQGYNHYEISNLSLNTKISRHNLKYWSMAPYLGLGLGAHSYVNTIRSSRETDLNTYIKLRNQSTSTTVWSHANTKQEIIEEYIFTGLRKTQGISFRDFKQIFNIDFLKVYDKQLATLKTQHLINIDILNQKIGLTKKGLDLANTVFIEFLQD